MITFFFTVNKSFLEYVNHPITIPRKSNSSLIKEIYSGAGNKNMLVCIIPPNGRILNGQIYYGKSSYGSYYQIKVLGNYPSDYFGDLKIGEIIGVSIKKTGEKINVKITSPNKLREIAEKLFIPTEKDIIRKAEIRNR